MKKIINNTVKLFIIIFTLILVFPFSYISASLQDDLNEVQKKLKDIRDQKNALQNEINKDKNLQNQLSKEILVLKSQIDILDAEIKEKDLIIQELNLQIDILTEDIKNTTNEIVQAKSEIIKLEIETDKRLVDIYISEKTSSSMNMFLSENGGDILKLSVYQQSFQMDTNRLLGNLNDKKATLEAKQLKLENDKKQVVADQSTLENEKIALTNKQKELDQQRAVFYKKRNEVTAGIQESSDLMGIYTEEEQKTLALQNKIEQELFNNVNNLGNGTYVVKGTIIGRQGYSGYVIPKGPAGAHLHFATKVNGQSVNPCSLIPSGKFSNCGGSGTIDWPLRNPFYYTSGYGWRWGKWHDAIDIASSNTHAYIYAAHDGWLYKGGDFNGGIWRKVCETKDNCSKGLYTFYLHLAE